MPRYMNDALGVLIEGAKDGRVPGRGVRDGHRAAR